MEHSENEVKENKKMEIESIHIQAVENGFTYEVSSHSAKGDIGSCSRKEYVYETLGDVLDAVKDDLGSPHMREYPDKEKMKKVFHEVKENEPEIVGKTRKQKGKEAARKQLVAIALNKAMGGLFKK